MNYQYFGLFLNEHNRNELMKIIFANPIIANLVLHGRIWKTVYLHRLIPLSQFRA